MDFDKVYWDWRCSLAKKEQKTKVDPLKRTCRCGCFRYFNKIDYIRMLIFGSITYRCPQCQRKHKYKLTYQAVEIWDDDVKKENKLLGD